MDSKVIELYIHIPFCVKKCDYCDFLSFAVGDEIKAKYVNSLIEEIKRESQLYSDRHVSSVFIGGGTPSSLALGQIYSIMDAINSHYSIDEDAEITIECNPGTLTAEKLKEYKKSGINRLSIGLQSADNQELKILGRIHDYETFVANYKLARECGFCNINIDLISGLPGQSVEDFVDSLRKVIGLNPEHISSYGLIIEEGTAFYNKYGEGGKNEKELPSEEVEREIYYKTRELFSNAGYKQYEISNYSRPGYECRHNIGYWTRREYIGFGLGAASLCNNVRWSNERDIAKYIDGIIEGKSVKCEEEILSIEDQVGEFMFLGLRLCDGVRLSDFRERFKKELQEVGDYEAHTSKMLDEGLLEIDEDNLRLTHKGMDLANYVMCGYV